MDEFVNSKGKIFINNFETNDLILLNGRAPSDTPANYTFLGPQGASVIDLVWFSSGALPFIQDLQVLRLATFSDHFPVVLTFMDFNNSSQLFDDGKVFNEERIELFSDTMSWRGEVARLDLDIDSSYSNLISAIKDVSFSLNMYKSYSKNININRRP